MTFKEDFISLLDSKQHGSVKVSLERSLTLSVMLSVVWVEFRGPHLITEIENTHKVKTMVPCMKNRFEFITISCRKVTNYVGF